MMMCFNWLILLCRRWCFNLCILGVCRYWKFMVMVRLVVCVLVLIFLVLLSVV